jgi:hypothetical protein
MHVHSCRTNRKWFFDFFATFCETSKPAENLEVENKTNCSTQADCIL